MKLSRRILVVLAVILSIFVSIPVFAKTVELKKDELSIDLDEKYYLITKDNYESDESYENLLNYLNVDSSQYSYDSYKYGIESIFNKGAIAMLVDDNGEFSLIIYTLYKTEYKQNTNLQELCETSNKISEEDGYIDVKCSIENIDSQDNKYDYLRQTMRYPENRGLESYLTKYSFMGDGFHFIFVFETVDDYNIEESEKFMSNVTIHQAKTAAEMDSEFVSKNWIPIVIVVVVALIAFIVIIKQNKKNK